MGGSARFAQPQRDNGPAPTPEEKGARIWKLVHSYRMGQGFSSITAVAPMAGGCLVRTTSKSARGQSEALCFVPGACLADFASPGGAR